MKRGEKVLSLARKLKKELRNYSKKVEIAGSIRRKEKNPGDIDIVIIPDDREKLEEYMGKMGKNVQRGERESTWKINGIKVELYYTTPEEWGATLLAYSGRKGSNIGLRVIAKKKGFKLTQHGLFIDNKRIAGKTEREIYKALNRPYKEPWER